MVDRSNLLFEECSISECFTVKSRRIEYNNSVLFEIVRSGWDTKLPSKLEHLYWIYNKKGNSRDWGVHEFVTDHYFVVYGSIKVALCDFRKDSATFKKLEVIELDFFQGDGLIIAPGVAHSFYNITEFAVLLNSKTPSYSEIKTDKSHIPMPNSFTNFTWGND